MKLSSTKLELVKSALTRERDRIEAAIILIIVGAVTALIGILVLYIARSDNPPTSKDMEFLFWVIWSFFLMAALGNLMIMALEACSRFLVSVSLDSLFRRFFCITQIDQPDDRSKSEYSKNTGREKTDAEKDTSRSAKKDESFYGKKLGLSGQVSKNDVRAAYLVLAKQYHPDKVFHLGPKLKEVAESEMKEINEAYQYFRDKYGW